MKNQTLLLLVLIVIFATSCGKYITETGTASYYADKFIGRPTASGKIFKQNKLTAAHKTLPLGTRVKIKNRLTGKTVKVTINDRGPFVKGRLIDLSKKAARRIGMLQQGNAEVELKYRKTTHN